MNKIEKIIKEGKFINNVINVNVNNSNNDNSVASESNRYALKSSFIPNTEETQLAEKIAKSLNDLKNYALYLHVVNRLGVFKTHTFWRGIQEEIKDKRGSRYEIRDPRKYFVWKFKKGIYQ